MKHIAKLRRAGPVALLCLCVVLMAAANASAVTAALAAEGGFTAAPLPTGATTTLYHPNQTPDPGAPYFNHYGLLGETPGGAGFSLVASLSTDFQDISTHLDGTITSEVWAWIDDPNTGAANDGDGHLLFTYRIENNSGPDAGVGGDEFSTGNIVMCMGTQDDSVEIIDTGEIQGSATFFPGTDYYSLNRSLGQQGVFRWTWYNTDPVGGGLFLEGQLSNMVYIETDAFFYSRGISTIQDGGHSQGSIAVLVPCTVPEPMTMLGLFLGLGGVGAYIRKRRMA